MCTVASVGLTVIDNINSFVFCFLFYLIVLHCFPSLLSLSRTTNSSLSLMQGILISFSDTLGAPIFYFKYFAKKVCIKKDSNASSQENNKPYFVIRVQIRKVMHVFKDIFDYRIILHIHWGQRSMFACWRRGRKNL